MRNHNSTVWPVFVTGMCFVIVQCVFFRELLTLFLCNELIAILLFSICLVQKEYTGIRFYNRRICSVLISSSGFSPVSFDYSFFIGSFLHGISRSHSVCYQKTHLCGYTQYRRSFWCSIRHCGRCNSMYTTLWCSPCCSWAMCY